MDNEGAKKDSPIKKENVIAFDAQGNLTDVKKAAHEPGVDLELDDDTQQKTEAAPVNSTPKANNEPAQPTPTEKKSEKTSAPESKKAEELEKHSEEETIVADEEMTTDNGSPEEVIKKLKDKLKKVTAEKQDYLDKWQRDKAEFINIRKRDQESNTQYVKFAKEDLVIDLIPVLDSFEMAFSNKELWEKVDKGWREGVQHIYAQLKNILANNNLHELAPLGEKFDPMRDEAVEFEPVSEERFDHMITKVIQKGYSLNGKVIKAPKVKVGEFKKA